MHLIFLRLPVVCQSSSRLLMAYIHSQQLLVPLRTLFRRRSMTGVEELSDISSSTLQLLSAHDEVGNRTLVHTVLVSSEPRLFPG